MRRYNPKEIEPKWQAKWEESGIYNVDFNSKKPKYVGFGMFNYPSGAGIHVGHVRNFTIPDVITRTKRQQGFESYQPVGWDSFGMPAENYAIKTGVAPQVSIKQAIEKYHTQYRAMGWAMDWSKEIDTTEPEYYKWTQWCFAKLFENGLAYQKESPQWWCDQCKTVLADEQVIAGQCWRHDNPDDPFVTKRSLRQWFFKITDYADELLEATDSLDWTQSVKSSQKSWIGKSKGAEVDFRVCHPELDSGSSEGARSYIMGQKNISQEDIESIGGTVAKTTESGHLCVKFPKESSQQFEDLITEKMEPGFWNEYVGDEIVFIFKHKDGKTERFVLSDETNEKIRILGNEFNNHEDDSSTRVEDWLKNNEWYKDWIPDHVGNDKPVIRVFTTRPDTLYGATFLVLAPEHSLVREITTEEHKAEVQKYTEVTVLKSEVQRQQDADKEKTGVFTGAYAINPINNQKIPVWIADYVLMGYGTGAIMAVPAHDVRDNQFAKKFGLSILEVVAPDFGDPLPEPVDVTGPVVIGYDPETKMFMSLINTRNQMRWLVSGGLEEGEDYTDAAKREMKEEAGFTKIEKLIQLGGPTYSYYYNSNKDSNRRSFSYMFLAIINQKDQQKQELEEHEQYDVAWSDLQAIRSDFEKEPSGRGHWIDAMTRVENAIKAYSNKTEYDGPIITGEGVLFNSGDYSGMSSSDAREKIVADLQKVELAKEKVQYKMRDWLISRQRYWGAPIPIIHCETDGPVLVPEADLPVVLPVIEDYRPTGGEASVLAGVEEWVNTSCPKCGGPGKRETDTMDGYVCSSWYFLRYMDPTNNKQAWDPKIAGKWMPIDCYNGGDHATAHLLYARFFNRFFHKLGLVESQEPFKKMIFNGKIKAGDGSAFSKSKGNGIDPLEVIEQGYGADAIRLYEMFAAPVELDVLWDIQGIPGAYRFLSRVWNITQEFIEVGPEESKTDNADILKITHKMIKKVTEDIEEDRFNTAIASLMELTNYLYKAKDSTGINQSGNWRFAIEALLMLVAPFAPHIAEELWSELGNKDTIHVDHWPMWEDKYLQFDTMKIVVQVNGKVRSTVEVDSDATKEQVIEITMKDKKVAEYLNGNSVKKTIYVPNRLVNFVI